MKITVISIFFPPEKGAAPSRIFDMCKMLLDEGHDVEVLTAFPNYPKGKIFEEYRGSFLLKEEIEGIKVRRHWIYPSNSKKPIARIISMVSFSVTVYLSTFHLLIRQPNITIINSPPLFLGFFSIFLSRMVSQVTVTNISDIWPLSALELGVIKRGKLYSILERMEKMMYRLSHACLGQSEETLKHVKSIVANKKTFLYRNLAYKSVYFHQNIPYNSQNLKIIYAGLLGVAQGIFDICKNIDFKDLGVEFHIYGAGNEERKIVDYIFENQGQNIFYHGLVSKSEIPILLTNYHATLIPLVSSIYGAFPSKVFMAMSSGLPILFSGEGEGADVVERYGLGWVNAPGDFEGLNDNIVKLKMIGEKKYNELRRNCEEALNRDFKIENQFSQLEIFLQNLRAVK